ncbi:phage tail spike protein [Bacillus niameyensis]|uniref:phage tail spike protein n=1 Tax=Bacillus niameyensis TaxID=1522308 RepID=UPI000785D3C3|nr:phage tail spike protein [Bacillus niameyensis]
MYKITLINDGAELVIHHPDFNDLKVIDGKIKQIENAADSFSFTILPNNPGYGLIRPLKTLITVENMLTEKIEFDGRILAPTDAMSDTGVFAKSFICESELGYLNDSCQRHGEYHDMTVREFFEVMIKNHNSDIAHDDIDKKFVLGNVTVTNSTDNVYRYLGYDNTFDSIDDKLISRLGGVIKARKENGVRYLDYLAETVEIKQTEIRLAKNLKSITKEVDPSEIITRLIPLGMSLESEDEGATDVSQARLTIASVNGGKDYLEDEEARSNFSVVTRSKIWDDITKPSILMTRGQQYLQENNRVKVKYFVSALDLSLLRKDPDSFEVGYYYPVINPVMGINETLKVIGKTIDIINPNQNDLTIGDKFKTTAQYNYEANKAQQNVVELQQTVSRQSNKIGTLTVDLTSAKTELEATKQRLENYENITDEDIISISNSIESVVGSIERLEQMIEDIPGADIGLAWFDQDGLMSSSDFAKLYDISKSVTNNNPNFPFYDFGVYISYAFQEFDKNQAEGSAQRNGYYYLVQLLEVMARKIDNYEFRLSKLEQPEGGA